MKTQRVFGLLFLIAVVTIGFGYWQAPAISYAPDQVFKSINGESIHLADLKGRPVLVTFWATDCPGCIEEIPHLISLHQQFSAQGLTIIAIAMSYDPPNHVLTMAQAKHLPYFVALDPTASHAQAFGNVQLTPTTFLINREGQIILSKTGAFDLADLQNRLANL